METESFTGLRRKRVKNHYHDQTMTTRPRYVYNVGVQSNSIHHAAFLEASVYTWHDPNIHVSESNIRAIPAVMLFPGRLFFY